MTRREGTCFTSSAISTLGVFSSSSLHWPWKNGFSYITIYARRQGNIHLHWDTCGYITNAVWMCPNAFLIAPKVFPFYCVDRFSIFTPFTICTYPVDASNRCFKMCILAILSLLSYLFVTVTNGAWNSCLCVFKLTTVQADQYLIFVNI